MIRDDKPTRRIPLAWIVGNTRDMGDAVQAVVRHAAEVQCRATLADALRELSQDAPDLVLVCQQWPEEYRTEEVEQLLESLPLARIVCSYGPWCGSDGRTRVIWPFALRVPAERAASRILAELDVIAGRRLPLPRTAGLEEVFTFDAGVER
ncbi:MAG: hypothetical protein KDA90_22970 [Planctomycetaceae bacterium]|nr:hypothetical protein [Planctomycetaceae bacterium]